MQQLILPPIIIIKFTFRALGDLEIRNGYQAVLRNLKRPRLIMKNWNSYKTVLQGCTVIILHNMIFPCMQSENKSFMCLDSNLNAMKINMNVVFYEQSRNITFRFKGMESVNVYFY